MRILLIEDDYDMAQTVLNALRKKYVIDLAFTGEDGEYLASINEYDLVVIDIGLPDKSGIDVCRAIVRENPHIAILMLTGESGVDYKVRALDFGADDYLVKPFHFSELHARIRALLRRNSSEFKTTVLQVGELFLDTSTYIVKRGETILSLRRKEIALLEYMMRNSGHVLTRSMILEHVWDGIPDSFNNTVDVHIKKLRDHVDRTFSKKMIKTIHGIGYKLDP